MSKKIFHAWVSFSTMKVIDRNFSTTKTSRFTVVRVMYFPYHMLEAHPCKHALVAMTGIYDEPMFMNNTPQENPYESVSKAESNIIEKFLPIMERLKSPPPTRSREPVGHMSMTMSELSFM